MKEDGVFITCRTCPERPGFTNFSRCHRCISMVWSRKLLFMVLLSIIFGLLYQVTYENANVEYLYPTDSYTLPCEMPKLDPFDPLQLALVRKTEPIDCDVPSNVVYVDETNTLQINDTAVQQNQLDRNKIRCKCKIIRRVPNSDTSVNYSDTFGCDPPFRIHGDFFKIKCLYENKEIIDSQLTNIFRSMKICKPNTDEHYNVILFGIDSVSTNDALRQVPETVKYLQEELGATIFAMHNRIGGHTFDNIVPMLTGLLADTHDIPYLNNVGERFKMLPLIWRNFSKLSYATFYAEDRPEFHTFNFQKEGFSEQPTDHYLRPFWLAEPKPSKWLFWKNRESRCLGNVPKYLVQMNYLRQFIHTYRNERKFAVSHINDLSHQDVNDLHQAERHLTDFFKWLKNEGHLKDTFLVVYSDHGPRGQSQTHQSLLETNLPFLGIVLPSNLTRTYPNLFRNLKNNANVLTTHFDVFATLRDILNRQFLHPSVFYLNGKPRGISLFRNIGVQRSCKDASIPEQFCTCFGSKPLNATDNPFIQGIAQSVVDKLNNMTSSEDMCAHLTLSAILETRVLKTDTRREVRTEEWSKKPSSSTDDTDYNAEYKIMIETVPGNGKFYATSKVNSSGKRYVLDDIERVNRYNNQSYCISNDILRPICYCKP